jgi:hypothetical protein
MMVSLLSSISFLLAFPINQTSKEETIVNPVVVYKPTPDNWYPSYYCQGIPLKLVCISFNKIELDNDYLWRVSAWGDDDFGLCKDFDKNQENSAWNCFCIIIGLDVVSIKDLIDLNFVSG